MEAELVRELPTGDGWQYEPKWDGFRGVFENLEGELRLWSRNARPLLRYFPELVRVGDRMPPRSALDGEVVIERDGRLDFDAMQMRLHPAESRIRRLSTEIPSMYIAFDVLLWDGAEVWSRPLEARREQLDGLPFTASPATRDVKVAQGWLERLEVAGFDGVIAKQLGAAYQPGSREAVRKVKAHKSAECVILGVRFAEKDDRLATLLLGLYDQSGEPRYVGSAAVAPKREGEIRALVEPLFADAPDQRFSEPNRWGGGELEQRSIRPELVVEVRYDKWQGMRFRHGTRLLRFRPDKKPEQCTVDQVDLHPGEGDPTVTSLLET
jgi:ATP-dependent DNA ligase